MAQNTPDAPAYPQVILHLTDLHFGWKADGEAERDLSLKTLLATLESLDAKWKPTIICLSGDIGNFGSKTDYDLAKSWLDELLSICKLSYDRVIVAAGNHDIDRSVSTYYSRPNNSAEADKNLRLPLGNMYKEAFKQFSEFCIHSGIPPMTIGGEQSWLVGERMLDGIRFVTLNSSWFCQDNEDKNKLWLGYPQIRKLAAEGKLSNIYDDNTPITVTLVHHPFEWLHEEEQQTYGSRPNPRDYLAQRTHLILTGHTHARMAKVHRIAEAAYHFTCGAAYAGGRHPNGFRLIKLLPEQFDYQSYEYDSGADKPIWTLFDQNTLSRQRKVFNATEITELKKKSLNISELRVASAEYATNFIDFKSRLMKPTGVLPAILPQKVSVQITLQASVFDEGGNLISKPSEAVTLPLYDAVREARYSLLLGELGSGKSTLAANLVLTTMERAQRTFALIVPAKDLASEPPSSPAAVLQVIDKFIQEHVSFSAENPPLSRILQENIEVLLVLDGLDEIHKTIAAQLLRYLARLAKTHSTLQVVATARPVELTGVSFDDWKIIRTLALEDQQRVTIFKNEVIASGVAPEIADQQASELLDILKGMPALDAVATSPLFLRLLYPKVSALSTGEISNELTLADLLFEVVVERLERWQQRDEKQNNKSSFETNLVSAESKAILFGQLAKCSLKSEQLRVESAQTILVKNLPSRIVDKIDKFQLASEALNYLQKCGFITGESKIEFVSQPLTEMLAAMALASEWSNSQGELIMPALEEWRVVGFAASIARRWQLQEKVRRLLTSYCQNLVAASPMYLTAVATISIEFQDAQCAQLNLQAWQAVLPGQFAFNFNGNERSTEAGVIAQLIFIAGQKGFEWLYVNYLDARQPTSRMGLALVEEVIRHYVILLINNAGEIDITPLTALVAPHQAYRSVDLDLSPYLVLLLPNSYTLDVRVWLLCSHIGAAKFFNKQATDTLKEIAASGEFEIVLSCLLKRVKEYGSINLHAAALWFELNRNLSAYDIPQVILIASLKAMSKVSYLMSISEFAIGVETLLGKGIWIQHVRWALSDPNDEIAASAAITLFQSGLDDFWALNTALFRGINSYFENSTAEEVLNNLIIKEGESAIRWLVEQATQRESSQYDWSKGLGTSLWRILLSRISQISDGPQLLGKALSNLSTYTLSRHPEIREQFNQLLSGPCREDYIKVLNELLTHYDPKTRWGAATVLVVHDPQQQVDALLVAVQAQEGMNDAGVDNWTQFCLSLSFGQVPLNKLKEALPELTPKARTFALALLFVRGVNLSTDEKHELFISLLKHGNWQFNHYPEKPILSNSNAKPVLLEVLESDNISNAKQAASSLLSYHLNDLSLEQIATCLYYQTSISSLKYSQIDVVERLRIDTDFSVAVEDVCSKMEARFLQPSVLRLLSNAIEDPAKWEELVWAFFQGEDVLSLEDTNIRQLYDIGLKYPEYRKHIGEAALKFSSEHSSWQYHQLPKAVQWFVLLADEFLGGLPSEKLISALQLSFNHKWYDRNYSSVAARALLARLDEIPESLFEVQKIRSEANTIKINIQNQQELYEQIAYYSRESSSIPDEVLIMIYNALFYDPFTEEQIQKLSVMGTSGRLIALSLRFCYGQQAQLEETVPLFKDFLFQNSNDNDRKVKERLLNCWIQVRNRFIHQHNANNLKQKYIATLDNAFLQSSIWPMFLAIELLRVRGSLLPDQFRIIVHQFIESHGHAHTICFGLLCEWLGSENIDAVRSDLIPVLRDGLNSLDQLPLHQTGREINAEAYFLFSFAYWAFAEDLHPATQNIYLKGIKLLFSETGKDSTANFAKLLEAAEPLLRLVPTHYLAQAVEHGKQDYDPAIRQICRLMVTLSGSS